MATSVHRFIICDNNRSFSERQITSIDRKYSSRYYSSTRRLCILCVQFCWVSCMQSRSHRALGKQAICYSFFPILAHLFHARVYPAWYTRQIKRMEFSLPQTDIRFNLTHIIYTKCIFRSNLVRIFGATMTTTTTSMRYLSIILRWRGKLLHIIFHVVVYGVRSLFH